MSIAIVTAGTFRYRTEQGDALLVPGALLLGNEGACFECGHEHAAGDRCLSFHFTKRFLEAAVSAIPGARATTFSAPRIPPLPELTPLLAQAETAREEGDQDALEEVAVRLSAAVVTTLADVRPSQHAATLRDIRRVTEVLHFIEANVAERISLAAMARKAGMSAYHFLRIFRRLVGLTPHQFVLRARLHRAATLLKRSDQPVSTIALDAGFEDLSTFNRRFRRVMGVAPGLYRAQ